MSAPLKKTFSWLWTVALLTATIGLSVQQIYCQCLGKTTTSGIALAAAAKQAQPAACCQKEQSEHPSCCAKEGPASKKDSGCNKKTTKVFQLKTEFLVDHPTAKSFDFPLWINDFPMLRRMARPVICAAHIFRQALPPPPLAGWDLCLRHQLARC